jgi:hypothetical protein
MTDVDAERAKGPDYSYRASLIGAPWEFRLTPTALVWSIGARSGTVPYADVRKVQMLFRPGTMQQGTFVTYLWADGHPKVTINSTSRKNVFESLWQDASYRDFIVALHRRLADSGARPDLMRGVKPYIYWPGVALLAMAALGFALLIVRALQTQAWGGAAFIAAFFAVFVWQLGGYFRRNKPGVYRADDLPDDLLPGG